ncbi:MAG: DUF4349 domain-containing protein [Chitinispirillaceae bacterium]
MSKCLGFFVFCFLMLLSCQQNDVATDFYERIPEQRASKLVPSTSNTVERKGIAGIGYGAGYGSGFNTSKDITNSGKSQKTIEQMLIKKADLRFEVKDYNAARDKIGKIIEEKNAYISSERETKSDYQISNSIEIRVIAEHFESIIDSLIAQAKNLDEKNITVQDVTEEYVDIKARLKAKREVEMRYLDILKGAKTVEDILQVEQKLGDIREQIEAKEGRLKYLTHQVSYSTINLNFYKQKVVVPKSRIDFVKRLSASFLNGWKGLTEFSLGLVSIWPFLLIMSGIGYSIFRIIKKIRKRKSAPNFENEEQ